MAETKQYQANCFALFLERPAKGNPFTTSICAYPGLQKNNNDKLEHAVLIVCLFSLPKIEFQSESCFQSDSLVGHFIDGDPKTAKLQPVVSLPGPHFSSVSMLSKWDNVAAV